jgi:very-short-patch-repair endonuclease
VVDEGRAYRERRSPHRADRIVAALAARQHGVVHVGQLYAAGLDKDAIARRVAAGWLHRLHRGVYAVGHLALTPRSHQLAAVYAYRPAGLLSHRSAAALWGLLRSAPRIEVTVPRACRPRSGIVLHRSRRIHEEDRRVVDGIPVTSVARTMVDLAEGPERYLLAAVREAKIRRLFDLRAIDRTLERLPGRRGRHRLRRVLGSYRPESAFTRSGAERRLVEVCRDHRLPVPQANVWIDEFEVDFYWPDARIVVELDSPTFHLTTHAFHADRRRDRVLAGQGIQVVRVPLDDLERPEALASELARILARRMAA